MFLYSSVLYLFVYRETIWIHETLNKQWTSKMQASNPCLVTNKSAEKKLQMRPQKHHKLSHGSCPRARSLSSSLHRAFHTSSVRMSSGLTSKLAWEDFFFPFLCRLTQMCEGKRRYGRPCTRDSRTEVVCTSKTTVWMSACKMYTGVLTSYYSTMLIYGKQARF